MSQHIGAPCKPLVKPGDLVAIGQKIGDGEGLCVPVHASVSGKVKAVEARPLPGGTEGLCVVIENDFQNTYASSLTPHASIDDLTADELTTIIHDAGITGMGGAGFPTYAKIASGVGKVDTIIINCAECEPYITSDDRLAQECPDQIVGGARVLMKTLGLRHAVIGIEANKKTAARQLKAICPEGGDIDVLVLRTRYPQGAEKQLIQSVTGRQVPPGGLPAHVGCAVFNATTCAAVYDAVYLGRPLTERIVTVTGGAVKNPCNLRTPIGTSYRDLLVAAGGLICKPYKILSGGPMMGLAQYTIDVPTTKGANAVTVLTRQDCQDVETPHCIRCGRCVQACPMHLMPLFLQNAYEKGDVEELDALHVMDCIECGACAYGCPAKIPLTQGCRGGKQLVRNAQAAAKKAAEQAAKAEKEATTHA